MLHLALTVGFGIVFFFALVVLFEAISSHVQSVSQVSALTERIEFVVTQPRLAAIPVRQMRIATDVPALNGKCINGLILPALNADVIYGRVGYGPLSIRIVPPDADQQHTVAGEFDPGDGGRTMALKGNTDIETDQSCAPNALQKQAYPSAFASVPLPLPIWGKARIGSEFKGIASSDPEPRLMLSGQMKVSARAVEFLPGVLGIRSTLYPVTDLDLPVGSRLETYTPQQKSASQNDAPAQDVAELMANWWGAAYVDSEKPALDVELATDASKLALFHPNQHEPDIIEVSRLNQIFEDPNLIRVYKLLGVFAISAAMCKWLADAFQLSKTDGKSDQK